MDDRRVERRGGVIFALRARPTVRTRFRAWRRLGAAPRTLPSLCPGPKVGAVAVFGLTADRDGLTDYRDLRASRWIVDCFGSADT